MSKKADELVDIGVVGATTVVVAMEKQQDLINSLEPEDFEDTLRALHVLTNVIQNTPLGECVCEDEDD